MRILQVSHNHHIVGGSDSVFFATSALLSNAGHEVVPFCLKSPNDISNKWRDHFPAGANTGEKPLRDIFRYFYNVTARRNLATLLDQAGPFDVAHLHIYHGKQTPSILSELRARGIPVIQTLHEYKLCCPVYTLQRRGKPCELCVDGTTLNALRHRCKDGSFLRTAVMTAESATSRMLGDVRLVDRFLCVSAFQRALMARSGIPDEKLFTLHNFVDPSTDRVENGHDGYLLYFGRIEKLKGLQCLVQAAQKTGVKLKIAGDGNWLPTLEKLVAPLENIELLGFQSGAALTRLIGRSMAVVVPSEWYENCPMTVLEAKALGRPVIGARIGGIPELICDRDDGYLFEAGNVEDLSRAIAAMSRAEFKTLSTNARTDAENRFSTTVHLQSLVGHYDACRALRAADQVQYA